MPKYYKGLLNKALFDKEIKFLPLKTNNGNVIYIENDKMSISELFDISIATARELQVQIILNYKGIQYLIDEKTTKVDITDQLTKQNIYAAYYNEILQTQKIEEILNNATVKNIKTTLKRVQKINEKIGKYPGLKPYRKTTISKKLYELYKINQPDRYLDNMIEEFKNLIELGEKLGENIIYVNYNDCVSLDMAYINAKSIAKEHDKSVLFEFNGYDILIDKNTTIEDVEEQYNMQHQINYMLYAKNQVEENINNLTIENVSNILADLSWLLNEQNGFRKYVNESELNRLSKTLYNMYKGTFPDRYLDAMVDEVVTLVKKKEIKGE